MLRNVCIYGNLNIFSCKIRNSPLSFWNTNIGKSTKSYQVRDKTNVFGHLLVAWLLNKGRCDIMLRSWRFCQDSYDDLSFRLILTRFLHTVRKVFSVKSNIKKSKNKIWKSFSILIQLVLKIWPQKISNEDFTIQKDKRAVFWLG